MFVLCCANIYWISSLTDRLYSSDGTGLDTLKTEINSLLTDYYSSPIKQKPVTNSIEYNDTDISLQKTWPKFNNIMHYIQLMSEFYANSNKSNTDIESHNIIPIFSDMKTELLHGNVSIKFPYSGRGFAFNLWNSKKDGSAIHLLLHEGVVCTCDVFEMRFICLFFCAYY
jgi:hypothetical protein